MDVRIHITDLLYCVLETNNIVNQLYSNKKKFYIQKKKRERERKKQQTSS